MLYKFVLASDEVENFVREIDIDPESTFLDFQKAIIESVKFSEGELTGFYICSENWEKEVEVLFMEMDSDASIYTHLMNETKLDELIEDEGQKLMFVFDLLTERAFFIELKEIIPGKTLSEPTCTLKRGNPPSQTIDFTDDAGFAANSVSANIFDDDAFNDEEGYNDDELNSEGFGDLNFEEQ
ncbi:MAG: hypothetical protein LBT04_06365 [Prevotellaceae bacterium]|jgi:hypothetical protein|nr:hypothetical protein [Prevotellaceae bacterium]